MEADGHRTDQRVRLTKQQAERWQEIGQRKLFSSSTNVELMQNFVDQVREQEDYAYEDRQDFIWQASHPWLSLAYRIIGMAIMAGCAALVGWGLSCLVGR
jgi:hypothetical protein